MAVPPVGHAVSVGVSRDRYLLSDVLATRGGTRHGRHNLERATKAARVGDVTAVCAMRLLAPLHSLRARGLLYVFGRCAPRCRVASGEEAHNGTFYPTLSLIAMADCCPGLPNISRAMPLSLSGCADRVAPSG